MKGHKITCSPSESGASLTFHLKKISHLQKSSFGGFSNCCTFIVRLKKNIRNQKFLAYTIKNSTLIDLLNHNLEEPKPISRSVRKTCADNHQKTVYESFIKKNRP
jgi:hypothetical protein